MNTIPHFIGGQPHFEGGAPIPVSSPVDGSDLGQVLSADSALVDRTVQSAHEAFDSWAKVPLKERVQPLYRFKHLVEANIGELASLVTKENGKTVGEAQAGIEKGIEVVEFACALPNFSTGALLEVSRGVDCYTRRYPLGVCVGITPFNFPAMVPLWMFPIAIATGNAFILKPSEQVPLTSIRMAELLQEAGLPDGIFNVLHGGRETVEALLDHAGIAAATFVGSTPVAKLVYERGQKAGKRMLALGGAKNHLVVMPDADPAVTAKNVVSSAMGCAGQRCMAASVLIAVGDCSAILNQIVEIAGAAKTGCDMGAIISQRAKERIEGYIERASNHGAKVVLDGRGQGPENGTYVGPTVIDDLKRGDEALADEIFGPVLSVIHVGSLDEALEIENNNPFGNAASIYTRDGATALYFEQNANAGMIGVNIGVPVPREPFSFGGWNDSKFGIGDITGNDGVDFWTKTKKITKKWSERSASNWMS